MPNLTVMVKPVSNSCNMRCKYCFYNDVSERRATHNTMSNSTAHNAMSNSTYHSMMSNSTMEALVRKAMNYAGKECSFIFQGGEPTLAGLGFYKEFVRLQREYNRNNSFVIYYFQTNGYALDREWADFFKANGFIVGLSLDGVQPAHDKYRVDAGGQGTYGKAYEAAELLSKCGVRHDILCVVTDEVASRPAETYNALRKHRRMNFIPYISPFAGRTPSDTAPSDTAPSDVAPAFAARAGEECALDPAKYAGFLKTTFDLVCRDMDNNYSISVRMFENYVAAIHGETPEQCGMDGVCKGYFLVEADGGVYPCDFYAADEWKLGDINANSFARMADCDAMNHFIGISCQADEGCAGCNWHYLCNGGCRRYREPAGGMVAPFSGGSLGKNIFCESYKEFFEYSVERMKKIFLSEHIIY